MSERTTSWYNRKFVVSRSTKCQTLNPLFLFAFLCSYMVIVSAEFSNTSKSLEWQDQGNTKFITAQRAYDKEHKMKHNEFRLYPHECYTRDNCVQCQGFAKIKYMHMIIFTSVEYFLYKLYWKRRLCHDSMKSIAMQISTAPPISFC